MPKKKKERFKKITPEIETKIINLYEKDKAEKGFANAWEIAEKLIPDIDLSIESIKRVVKNYCEHNGEEEKLTIKSMKSSNKYEINDIEKELINQLKKGRPAKNVYKIAVKMNALTPLLKMTLEQDYNFVIKEKDGEER